MVLYNIQIFLPEIVYFTGLSLSMVVDLDSRVTYPPTKDASSTTAKANAAIEIELYRIILSKYIRRNIFINYEKCEVLNIR